MFRANWRFWVEFYCWTREDWYYHNYSRYDPQFYYTILVRTLIMKKNGTVWLENGKKWHPWWNTLRYLTKWHILDLIFLACTDWWSPYFARESSMHQISPMMLFQSLINSGSYAWSSCQSNEINFHSSEYERYRSSIYEVKFWSPSPRFLLIF